MSSPDATGPRTVKITCPVCHELHTVSLAAAPQSVACGFCHSRMSVPSRAQVTLIQASQALQPQDVGEYAIAAAEQQSVEVAPVKKISTSAQRARPAERTKPQAVVQCPVCHERLRVTIGNTPGQIECTFCQTSVPVPTRDQLQAREKKAVAPRSREQIGEYGTTAPVAVSQPRMQLFDRLAEVKQVALPPPPNWTFFSGVFHFPWRGDVLLRWGFLAFGFTLLPVLVITILAAAGGGPGGLGTIAIGFFVLPLIWIAFWTMSYAASCCLVILESTAAGLDRIETWPDPVWKEWMLKLLYLGWIAALPTVAAYGVGKLVSWQGGPFWPVMLATLFTLYPIVLLSALEANSIWIPLTAPILKSLFTLWWGWGLFYLLSGLMFGGLGALVHFGLPGGHYATWLVFSPLFAASLLIYARLLGRLAWRIGRQLTG